MYVHDLNYIPNVKTKTLVTIQNLDTTNISKIHNVKLLNNARLIQRLERGDKCYVAIHGGKAVSYHWVQFSGRHFLQQAGKSYFVSDRECYIYHVRVLEEYRNQGINQFVYSHILNDCKKSLMKKIWIYTNLDNLSNRKGLVNLGFKLDYILYSLKIGKKYYTLNKRYK